MTEPLEPNPTPSGSAVVQSLGFLLGAGCAALVTVVGIFSFGLCHPLCPVAIAIAAWLAWKSFGRRVTPDVAWGIAAGALAAIVLVALKLRS